MVWLISKINNHLFANDLIFSYRPLSSADNCFGTVTVTVIMWSPLDELLTKWKPSFFRVIVCPDWIP